MNKLSKKISREMRFLLRRYADESIAPKQRKKLENKFGDDRVYYAFREIQEARTAAAEEKAYAAALASETISSKKAFTSAQAETKEEGIDIKGIDKPELLAALYNRSKAQGMGFFQATQGDMSLEEARMIIENGALSFDYLHGRVMKVNIAGDKLNPWGYDRDVGQGAAQSVVDAIKNGIASPKNNMDWQKESKAAVGLDMEGIRILYAVQSAVREAVNPAKYQPEPTPAFTAESVYGKLRTALYNNGLFESQADAVLQQLMTKEKSMEGRWNDLARDYPPILLGMLLIQAKEEALIWIDQNAPQHWARAMFTPDPEETLRKMQAERQNSDSRPSQEL